MSEVDWTPLVPLGPWLELCREFGVQYVPAIFSAPFPVRQICGALDGGETPELAAAFRWLDREVYLSLCEGEQPVARWECCCDGMKKYLATKGQGWTKEWTTTTCDDPRVIDCTVGLTTRLCVRPWVRAAMVAGFPVEFRVYYGPNGYLGTSSYYPQRPLGEEWLWAVEACEGYASVLAQAVKSSCGFTADFIVAPGAPLCYFLEGGPPHLEREGAHPCCFPPGKIEGVALAPAEGALTR